MHARAIPSILILTAFTLLSACGGGDSSSSSTTTTETVPTRISETLTISASLGRITDAPSAATPTRIVVYDHEGPAGGNVLGEATLESDGRTRVQVNYTEYTPAVVELEAGSNASYYDEASDTQEPLPQGFKLHAITIDPASTAVTPFTELAYQLAEDKDLFPLTQHAVEQLNGAISALFSAGQLDITDAPALLDQAPAGSSLNGDTDNLHAAMLAALAETGSGTASPALAVLEAMSTDILNGSIDGFTDGGPMASTPYPASTFATAWRQALTDFADQYGNADLRDTAFLAPLAERYVLSSAGLDGRASVKASADNFPGEVQFSRDDDGDWDAFPEGTMLTLKVEPNGTVELHSGDSHTGTTTPVPGWSVDVDNVTVTDHTLRPGDLSLEIPVPNPGSNVERFIYRVAVWRDLDAFFLVEDDPATPDLDRLAHVFAAIPFPWQNFFDDVHALAQSGTAMTHVMDSESPSLECQQTALASAGSGYPALLGLLDGGTGGTAVLEYSIEPQRVRYAENGNVREMWFDGEAFIRHDTTTDRVDVVRFGPTMGDGPSLWATNHGPTISEKCP